ncbi:hypothetical protein KKH50_00115 [Patescibacteria group bacterium]|nr:hypothetical protein [Patescibacteria group bacterium]
MSEKLKLDHLMTPQQAWEQLASLGYKSIAEVPIQQSDYLYALVVVSQSKQPMNLFEIRDSFNRPMRGRIWNHILY